MPKLLAAITAIDLSLHRLSRGRIGILDLAGLPHLVLSVPGRRSGILRSTPLLTAPRHQGWLVAGSNFGQSGEPAWVANLASVSRARIVWRGESIDVEVTELAGLARDSAWRALTTVWPNFELYRQRTPRVIRVFALNRIAVPSH